jgi:hypothetical protein
LFVHIAFCFCAQVALVPVSASRLSPPSHSRAPAWYFCTVILRLWLLLCTRCGFDCARVGFHTCACVLHVCGLRRWVESAAQHDPFGLFEVDNSRLPIATCNSEPRCLRGTVVWSGAVSCVARFTCVHVLDAATRCGCDGSRLTLDVMVQCVVANYMCLRTGSQHGSTCVTSLCRQ